MATWLKKRSRIFRTFDRFSTASGYVQPYIAFLFGIIRKLASIAFQSAGLEELIEMIFPASAVCYFARGIRRLSRYRLDDACEVFASEISR